MRQLHFYQDITEEGLIPVYYIALNEAAVHIMNMTSKQELNLLSHPVATMLEGLTIRVVNEDQYKRYDRHGKLREMSLVDFINAIQTMSEADFQKMVNTYGNPSVPTNFDSVVGELTLHYEICPSWLKVTASK